MFVSKAIQKLRVSRRIRERRHRRLLPALHPRHTCVDARDIDPSAEPHSSSARGVNDHPLEFAHERAPTIPNWIKTTLKKGDAQCITPKRFRAPTEFAVRDVFIFCRCVETCCRSHRVFPRSSDGCRRLCFLGARADSRCTLIFKSLSAGYGVSCIRLSKSLRPAQRRRLRRPQSPTTSKAVVPGSGTRPAGMGVSGVSW